MTLKDYLTTDMLDEPMTYREWLDCLPVINTDIYTVDVTKFLPTPYKPIHNYPTYPYTIPYPKGYDGQQTYFEWLASIGLNPDLTRKYGAE